MIRRGLSRRQRILRRGVGRVGQGLRRSIEAHRADGPCRIDRRDPALVAVVGVGVVCQQQRSEVGGGRILGHRDAVRRGDRRIVHAGDGDLDLRATDCDPVADPVVEQFPDKFALVQALYRGGGVCQRVAVAAVRAQNQRAEGAAVGPGVHQGQHRALVVIAVVREHVAAGREDPVFLHAAEVLERDRRVVEPDDVDRELRRRRERIVRVAGVVGDRIGKLIRSDLPLRERQDRELLLVGVGIASPSVHLERPVRSFEYPAIGDSQDRAVVRVEVVREHAAAQGLDKLKPLNRERFAGGDRRVVHPGDRHRHRRRRSCPLRVGDGVAESVAGRLTRRQRVLRRGVRRVGEGLRRGVESNRSDCSGRVHRRDPARVPRIDVGVVREEQRNEVSGRRVLIHRDTVGQRDRCIIGICNAQVEYVER